MNSDNHSMKSHTPLSIKSEHSNSTAIHTRSPSAATIVHSPYTGSHNTLTCMPSTPPYGNSPNLPVPPPGSAHFNHPNAHALLYPHPSSNEWYHAAAVATPSDPMSHLSHFSHQHHQLLHHTAAYWNPHQYHQQQHPYDGWCGNCRHNDYPLKVLTQTELTICANVLLSFRSWNLQESKSSKIQIAIQSSAVGCLYKFNSRISCWPSTWCVCSSSFSLCTFVYTVPDTWIGLFGKSVQYVW